MFLPAPSIDSSAQLDARPDVAIVGPRIVDGEGRAELSFGAMIAPLTELRQKVLVVGQRSRRAPIVSTVDRMTRQTREVDWVSGACLLIRRTDLEAVGLLDERFFLYTEDVDLCASVRARGPRVLFAADVEIQHLARTIRRHHDGRRVSAKPARLLRQAPSRDGCPGCALT